MVSTATGAAEFDMAHEKLVVSQRREDAIGVHQMMPTPCDKNGNPLKKSSKSMIMDLRDATWSGAQCCRQFFVRVVDQEGYLDKDMWCKYVGSLTGYNIAKRIFKSIDLDKDSRLYFHEFMVGVHIWTSTSKDLARLRYEQMFVGLDFHDRERVSETDLFNVLDDAYHSIFAADADRLKFRRDGQGKEEYTEEDWDANRRSDEKLLEKRCAQIFRTNPKPKLSMTGKLTMESYVQMCSREKLPPVLHWLVSNWFGFGRKFERMIKAALYEDQYKH